MANIGCAIGSDDRDLILTSGGDFLWTQDNDTVAQCVTATLLVYKGEWFLDVNHGVDYPSILGVKPRPSSRKIREIISAAIYQEQSVGRVDAITVAVPEDRTDRKYRVAFSATLVDGQKIESEVAV